MVVGALPTPALVIGDRLVVGATLGGRVDGGTGRLAVAGGRDPVAIDGAGVDPGPATTGGGDPARSPAPAGAVISGAPTHAPTTTTVTKRAMNARRKPRFMGDGGGT
jgi:hypothetical protein